MQNKESYQVAIDILRCHLGMSVEEARKELGLDSVSENSTISKADEILVNLSNKN